MNENKVTANERISKLMEEVLVKLSCLLSELNNGNEDVVENVILTKDETNVDDEKEITVNSEAIGNKEHVVLNNDDKEEIKLCGEHSFISCSFTL